MAVVGNLRAWLKGKRTYIGAAIGLLGAVAAWADGQIDTVGLLGAAWVAVQMIFIRAAIVRPAPAAPAPPPATPNVATS